jgi:hypothetical protein
MLLFGYSQDEIADILAFKRFLDSEGLSFSEFKESEIWRNVKIQTYKRAEEFYRNKAEELVNHD